MEMSIINNTFKATVIITLAAQKDLALQPLGMLITDLFLSLYILFPLTKFKRKIFFSIVENNCNSKPCRDSYFFWMQEPFRERDNTNLLPFVPCLLEVGFFSLIRTHMTIISI